MSFRIIIWLRGLFSLEEKKCRSYYTNSQQEFETCRFNFLMKFQKATIASSVENSQIHILFYVSKRDHTIHPGLVVKKYFKFPCSVVFVCAHNSKAMKLSQEQVEIRK